MKPKHAAVDAGHRADRPVRSANVSVFVSQYCLKLDRVPLAPADRQKNCWRDLPHSHGNGNRFGFPRSGPVNWLAVTHQPPGKHISESHLNQEGQGHGCIDANDNLSPREGEMPVTRVRIWNGYRRECEPRGQGWPRIRYRSQYSETNHGQRGA